MDTSSTTFCRFSPLRTPSMQGKHLKKYDSPRKDVSDTESIASVLTSEIRSIAHAVSDRLKQSSESVMMSSDDDLFISQSKKVASPVKSAKKRKVSDSTSLDTSSDSEPDTVKSTTKNTKMISPRKRVKLKSEVISSPKKLPSKSTSKFKRKEKDHEISEDSEDENFSERRRGSVSSVLTSSTDSSKGRRDSVSSVNSSNSSKGRRDSVSSVASSKGRRDSVNSSASSNSSKGGRESSVASRDSSEERKEKSDSDSAESSKSDSDSESRRKSIEKGKTSRKSFEKGKNMKNKGKRPVTEQDISEDSDFETSKSKAKKNEDKNKSAASKESSSSKSGIKGFRYKMPDNFEIDTSPKYLTKSEVQGKQLWLITAPDDFDISVLHRQKINLTGSNIVTDEEAESEKQYEVVARPNTSQMSSYNNASSQVSGSEEFVFGSEISGQLQVMGWIPIMPPVELAVSPPKKHRVPDDLKPTFVPFGSISPTRQNDEGESFEKVEKHKKKKKKKEKSRTKERKK